MNQLAERIGQLKKEKDIVLFARFYLDGNKDVADSIGDSCCLEGMKPNGDTMSFDFHKSAQEKSVNTLESFDGLMQKPSRLSRKRQTAVGLRCRLVQ